MLSLWTHAEPGPGPRALMEALTGGPDQALASRYRERLSRGERALLARCHRGGEEGPFGTASPAWLLCQWPEEPQGFRDFAMGCPPRCRALHGIPQPTLHLQPLGFTDTGCERSRAFMAAVRGYAEAFLPGFTVRLNEPLDVAESRSPCRRDARTGHWQIHADGLLHYLKGLRAPGRSCLLGLTLADLYAGNSADFVFEKCLPAEGVAVCSLARLDPDFDKRLREAGNKQRPPPWPGLTVMPRHAKELPMGGPWWQQQQRKQQEGGEQIHNQKHNQGRQQQQNQQQQAQDHLLQQEHLQQLERQQQTNPDQQRNHQEQDCHQQDQYDLSQKQNQQLDEHAQQRQEQQQPQDQLVNEHEQRYHQQQQQQLPPPGSEPTAPDRDADARDDHDEKEEEEEEEAWCRPRGPQGPWANASLVRCYSPAVVGLLQARLDPARSGDGAWFAGLSLPATPGGDFLLHSCKAVVHAACHLLGVAHCRWLACVMQGARSAAVARTRPPHLCPVCLHKLHHVAAFRLAPRYQCLLDWVRSQTTPDDDERTGDRDSDDLTPPRASHPATRAQLCSDNSDSTGRQPTERAERTATAEERRGTLASHEHRTATAAEDGALRDAGDTAAMDAAECGSLFSFERWLLACLDQLRGDDEAGNGDEEKEDGQEEEGVDETPPDWDRALEELRERTRQSRARRSEAEARAKEVAGGGGGGGGGSLRGFLNARVSTLRRQLKGNSSFRQMAEVRNIAEKSCKSLRAKLSVSERKTLQGAPSQISGISRDNCRKPDQ
ncbi:unnamed protein product [Lampetra planeri]